MISFEKIDKYSLRYALLFKYTQWVHNYIYNASFDIIGRENIPPKGVPTLVISNHQNGLLDALGILYSFKDGRQPVFIARGDIFSNKTAAKLLRFLKIMPAFRTIDVARSDVGKSGVTFLRAARVLIEGGTVAIFPEAGHEDCYHLGTFKKGFPRVAFKAEEEADFSLGLQILPIINHYSHYVNFRQKKVIKIGKPFTIEEFLDIYKEKPNDAYLVLNEKSRQVIKEMMLDVEDLTHYDEYRSLSDFIREDLIKQENRKSSYFPNHLWADKITTEKLDHIKKEDSALFQKIMDNTQKYNSIVQQFKFRNWLIGKKITFSKNFILTLLQLVMLPFFLLGALVNFLPFYAPSIFTKKIKDKMLHSSFNIVVGALISFPLFYLIYFVTIWIFFGGFLFGLIIVLLSFLLLFLFYYWQIWYIKLIARWKYWNLKRKSDSTLEQAIKLKNQLHKQLLSLLLLGQKD